MARLLKQSTAFTFRIGPFLDDTDGKTAEEGLSIAQGDIQISKAGGAFAQTSDGSPTTTHDTDGWYQCPLTTTDTGTLGTLTVQIVMSGALPVWEHFMVVPANVFDSLVSGSDYLEVDSVALSGDATAADNAEAAFDGTGYGFTSCTMPTVTTLTGHTAQTGDSYTRLGAPAGASVSADVAAVKAETASIVDDTGSSGVVVAAGSKTGYSLAADQGSVTIGTVTTLTGHTAQTGDTYAALPTNFSDLSIDVTTGRVDVSKIEGTDATDQINAACDTALTDYDAVVPADLPTNFGDLSITATTGRVDVAAIAGTSQTANDNGADINAILTDTDELQTDWTNGGRLDLILDDVLADTGELQTDWTNGGRLDNLLDACSTHSANDVWDATSASLTLSWETITDRIYRFLMNKMNITDADGSVALRNDGDSADIATQSITDNDTTTTRTKLTWS